MRNSLIILLCLITSVASAQKIRITSRKSGAEITVFPQKVKAVVNKDGEFFEGRVRPLPEYLMIGDHSVPYSQIGFLEVKKLNGRSFISKPLKWLGGALGIIGVAVTSVAVEGDESIGQVGAGVLMMGVGTLLLTLGEKTKPSKNSKITTLHTKEWEFSYLPNSEL
ncbi:MAG: hypothetical protein R8G66_29355 [Cytophagales bacterium]|nr:hypothetical protein [Cytophagales bacterium]